MDYNAILDNGYAIHIKRACEINNVDIIEENGLTYFYHEPSGEKALIKGENSEDDLDVLTTFVDILTENGEM